MNDYWKLSIFILFSALTAGMFWIGGFNFGHRGADTLAITFFCLVIGGIFAHFAEDI